VSLRGIESLHELVRLVASRPGLYVRWARDVDDDPPASVDGLSGLPLPGLSCNGLDPEAWWDGRPLELWVARRVHQYSPERQDQGGEGTAVVIAGHVVGRGPDNEPLVRRSETVAVIDDAVLREADAVVRASGH
jgi:hypothetical protein